MNEVKDARIYAGFHYRFSCNAGQAVGYAISDYILDNFLVPLHHDDDDDDERDRQD